MARRFLVWFWSGEGGGSQFAVRLAHRLSLQFGADSVALSLRADSPSSVWARELGLQVLPADVSSDRRQPLTTFGGLARGAKILAQHAQGADAVILPMNFAAAAPLSLTLRKPLIYCAHDPEPHPGDYEAVMQRVTQAMLLKRATHVVALSDYAASRLRCVAGKLHVAPLSSVFEPRQAPGSASGPTRFAFVGRMIAYKGVDLLAHALKAIRQRTDWRLTIAGDGPALTDKAISRFDMPQVGLRREWLSDADLERTIAECDVLLAPYRSATQSGLVAQALAQGKPVVVTPVGALREQIGEGQAGWIAEARTGAAFTRAIFAALDRGAEREHKAAGALQMAAEAWNADAWGWLGSKAVLERAAA